MESAVVARQKLDRLAGARSPRGVFLTVTLSTSRLDDWRQFAPTFLNSEFNRVLKELQPDKDAKRSLERDLERVSDIIKHDVASQTQGLALFADGGSELFERIELPLPLLNRVVIEPSPHVRPLVHALALMEPFVVARVSRDESSLYVVDEWGVAWEEELTGPWLKTSDRETGEVAIRRYFAAARQDSLVEQHFKEVGTSLGKLVDVSGTRRVVLCAQHDIASNFRSTLPQATAARIVAQIPFDGAATATQMLAPARTAFQEARHRELEDLALRIKDNVGSAGRGAAGFDDVLGALQRGQVQTILADRNYRPEGWRCGDCDWVSLAPSESCPVCGGGTSKVADAVAELIRLAVLQSAQIEVGEEISALDEMGGVAALLRYA
jgi:peptide chain release factor subunit 1